MFAEKFLLFPHQMQRLRRQSVLDVALVLFFWLVSKPFVAQTLHQVTLQIPDLLLSLYVEPRMCCAPFRTAERTSVTPFPSDESPDLLWCEVTSPKYLSSWTALQASVS